MPEQLIDTAAREDEMTLAGDIGYVWNEAWRLSTSLGIEVLLVFAWYWLLKNLGSF